MAGPGRRRFAACGVRAASPDRRPAASAGHRSGREAGGGGGDRRSPAGGARWPRAADAAAARCRPAAAVHGRRGARRRVGAAHRLARRAAGRRRCGSVAARPRRRAGTGSAGGGGVRVAARSAGGRLLAALRAGCAQLAGRPRCLGDGGPRLWPAGAGPHGGGMREPDGARRPRLAGGGAGGNQRGGGVPAGVDQRAAGTAGVPAVLGVRLTRAAAPRPDPCSPRAKPDRCRTRRRPAPRCRTPAARAVVGSTSAG